MTNKKPRITKRTYLGRVDLNEYFKVLIMEEIRRDAMQEVKQSHLNWNEIEGDKSDYKE